MSAESNDQSAEASPVELEQESSAGELQAGVQELLAESEQVISDTVEWRKARRAAEAASSKEDDEDAVTTGGKAATADAHGSAESAAAEAALPDADSLRARLYMSRVHAQSSGGAVAAAAEEAVAVAGSKEAGVLREEAVAMTARMLARQRLRELGLDAEGDDDDDTAGGAGDSKGGH